MALRMAQSLTAKDGATAAASPSSSASSIGGFDPGHHGPLDWNFDDVHFNDGGPLTAQYLLVLDAINFCFWPGTV